MNVRFLALLVSICAVIAGCSGLSKVDCLAADWEQIGFDDGENGIAASSADSLQATCAEPSAAVDIDAYQLGQKKGATLFCRTENGFDAGSQGKEYSVVCPPEFKVEYDIGYQFYIANKNISLITEAINKNNSDIGKLQSGISRANIQLSNSDLSPSEENQIRQSISSMESQIDNAERTMARLEPLLGQSRKGLAELKAYYGR
jgi:hypothetical protein